MALQTHTPGPWKFDGSREYHPKDVIRHNGMIVAVIPTDFHRINRMANACLIAAAPTLLEALKECADWLGENYEGPIEVARAAIALATPDQD
jgi:hypothetical protein